MGLTPPEHNPSINPHTLLLSSGCTSSLDSMNLQTPVLPREDVGFSGEHDVNVIILCAERTDVSAKSTPTHHNRYPVAERVPLRQVTYAPPALSYAVFSSAALRARPVILGVGWQLVRLATLQRINIVDRPNLTCELSSFWSV